MKYFISSCSNGKDSLAMTYRLIEEKRPLDEIIFYDTGMEFSPIYHNWDKLKKRAESAGIKCTLLNPECPFTYTMIDKPVNVGKANEHRGYAWCGGVCRWGTTEKLKALDKYCEERYAICYVGLAADEPERLSKERKAYKKFPLAEWRMTEKDCLDFCRKRDIGWKESGIDLYDILDRVSCWCCGNKNLWELYNIWKYLPHYWERLKALQTEIERPFKKEYSIFALEEKFRNGYIPIHRTRKKVDV